jgi:hypothetical protein
VVLGHVVVEGNAAFVYFKKDQKFYIVDPIRGIPGITTSKAL